MLAVPQRFARAFATLSVLALGTLLSGPLDSGITGIPPTASDVDVLGEPEFTLRLGRGEIALSGTTASAAHETGLQRIAADQFRAHGTTTDFKPGVLVPENWGPASMRLLYALAATQSASATLTMEGISLRAVTSDVGLLTARLRFVSEVLPHGLTIDDNIIVVSNETPLAQLCRKAFDELAVAPIGFPQASTDLTNAVTARLDKLVDFTYDCRDSRVAVVGHSDSSGNETWNERLSLARAKAVADYLVGAGIPAERLLVESRGSAFPIADNKTAYGRSRNRRIEFELR